jgi:hypothetical protein
LAGAALCTNCEAGKYKATAGVNTACDNCDMAHLVQTEAPAAEYVPAKQHPVFTSNVID